MSDSTMSSDRTWVRRERPTLLVIGLLVALILAMAATLVAWSVDHRPRAQVGAVLLGEPAADGDPAEASRSEPTQVLLPWARMEVTIGEPVDELPTALINTEASLRAPEGGSFVRVSLTPAEDYQIPLFQVATPFVSTAEAVLSAGGRDYPLTPDGLSLDATSPVTNFGGTVWVAVDGHPSDASLALTVDDQTQVVADGKVTGGRAADLASVLTIEEIRDSPSLKCGRPVRIAPANLRLSNMQYVTCVRKLVVRTPYVDGLGWADEGREFLAVHLALQNQFISVTDSSGRRWPTRDSQVTVTLDGSPSLGEVDVNSLAVGTLNLRDPDSPMQYIFDVPSDETAGDLKVSVTTNLSPTDPFDTDRRRLVVEWRLPSGDPR